MCLYHQLYARNRSEMKKSFLETRLQSLDFGNGTRPNCKRSCQIAVQNGRRRAPPTLPQPPPAAAAAADASTITAWRPHPPHPPHPRHPRPRARPSPSIPTGLPGLGSEGGRGLGRPSPGRCCCDRGGGGGGGLFQRELIVEKKNGSDVHRAIGWRRSSHVAGKKSASGFSQGSKGNATTKTTKHTATTTNNNNMR